MLSSKFNPVLCDNLEGWDGMGGRREVQEGGGICILMADSRLLYGSNHCKAGDKVLSKSNNSNNKVEKSGEQKENVFGC